MAYVSFAVDLTADEAASLMRVIEKAPELLAELRQRLDQGDCDECDGSGTLPIWGSTDPGEIEECPSCAKRAVLVAYIDGKEASG